MEVRDKVKEVSTDLVTMREWQSEDRQRFGFIVLSLDI